MSKAGKQRQNAPVPRIYITVPVVVEPTTQLATREPAATPSLYVRKGAVVALYSMMYGTVSSAVVEALTRSFNPGAARFSLLVGVIAGAVTVVLWCLGYRSQQVEDVPPTSKVTERQIRVPRQIVSRLYRAVRRQTGVELAAAELQTVLQVFYPGILLMIDHVLPVINEPERHDHEVVTACRQELKKLIADMAAYAVQEHRLAGLWLMAYLGYHYDPWKRKGAKKNLQRAAAAGAG